MPIHSSSVPVLVWGGGTGGVAAALQAARAGASTLLLTPGPWLGGMLSAAGVCCPDGNELTPWQTGLWGALLRALAVAEPTGLDHNWVSCFGFRPATAEAILRQWVQDLPNLRWMPNCLLCEVGCQGDRVVRVTVEQDGQVLNWTPQIVIDGSDLGELLGLGAGAFRLGWEAQELWGEPSAPSQKRLDREPFFQRQPIQSPTWVMMAQLDPDLPPPGGDGRGAAAADDDGARALLPPPFAGATDAFGLARTLTYGRLPQGLVMLNWPLHGNDWHADLAPLFAGTPDQQRRHRDGLAPLMQAHSLAFLGALANAAPGLQPAAVFPEPGSGDAALAGPSPLALMPYWREGRRLVGLSTVIEQDLLPLAAGPCRAPLPMGPTLSSSIAVGNYANDHHYPGGDWSLAVKSCRWGGRWSGTPFCIPYGALVSASTSNLLAADKGISVSHMANGATRLQPLVLNTGQAAGMAAALCVAQGCSPQELPPELLQRALIDDPLAPAAPFPLWDTPWHHPHWRQRQWAIAQDPGLLSVAGTLDERAAGSPGVAHQPPPEPHEQLFRGVLRGTAEQGFQLVCADRSWPLITLEPAMHRQLLELPQGRRIDVVACANPWGPWLRLSRFSDGP